MFQWTPEMVRFMQDAEEHTDYYQLLARRLSVYFSPRAHICDAGCGLGGLSVALLPYAGKVTAVDVSPEAIAALRARNTPVEAVLGDIAEHPPQTPYDAMVFCFFGSTREALGWAKRQCRGVALMVKKDWEYHRFSLEPHKLERFSCKVTERELEESGIPFSVERLELEFGQPFGSLEDATRFFAIYSKDSAPPDPDTVQSRLIPDPKVKYPYYLPSRKHVGILRVNTADIPERFLLG